MDDVDVSDLIADLYYITIYANRLAENLREEGYEETEKDGFCRVVSKRMAELSQRVATTLNQKEISE